MKSKTFYPRDLIIRQIVVSRLVGQGKLLSNWEKPYWIIEVLHRGAYKLENLDGTSIPIHKSKQKKTKIIYDGELMLQERGGKFTFNPIRIKKQYILPHARIIIPELSISQIRLSEEEFSWKLARLAWNLHHAFRAKGSWVCNILMYWFLNLNWSCIK